MLTMIAAEGTAQTFADIMSNVGSITTGITTMYSALASYWFVWLPITLTVFAFVFGKFKSLMMFRKRRR